VDRSTICTHLTCVAVAAALFVFALSRPAAALPIVPDSDAHKYVGQTVTVEGLVANVFTSNKGNTFLNFGRPYPKQAFTAVIFSSVRERFPGVERWQGKKVRVTGRVELYKDRPEIKLNSPSQLSAAE
jgi:DNA/RNA endonuclease YhcR with UshA esterase domain